MNAAPNTTPAPPDENVQLISRTMFIQVATLLFVTFSASMTGLSLDEQLQKVVPESATFPSVFNHKPSGTSGVRELVSKIGMPSGEWVLPYRQLPTIKGALVIISPSESLADFEVEQILQWVSEGNKLVYLDRFDFPTARKILKKLGLETKDGKSLVDEFVPIANSSAQYSNVPHLTVSAEKRMDGAPPLVSDKSGILLTEIQHGKGKILLGTTPTLISNNQFSSKSSWGNFQFFVDWIDRAPGEIWFDERCHGFSSNANVFVFLAKGPVGVALAQTLLILIVGVASAAQRFGQRETLQDKRKISSLEFIYGLANTYKRAKANTASLEIIGQAFRTRLCKFLTISPRESTDELLSALSANSLLPTPLKLEAVQFIKDYEEALPRTNLSDNELKRLISICDKITRQLNQSVSQGLSAAGNRTE